MSHVREADFPFWCVKPAIVRLMRPALTKIWLVPLLSSQTIGDPTRHVYPACQMLARYLSLTAGVLTIHRSRRLRITVNLMYVQLDNRTLHRSHTLTLLITSKIH